MRSRDVPTMMARVEATLEAAEWAPHGAAGVLSIQSEGDAEVDVAHLRHMADIDLDFQSGSDRAGIGPAIRMAKRLVRRSLRWYLKPMMLQQSEFNHATLDMIERLRLRLSGLGGGGASRVADSSADLEPARLDRWKAQLAGCDRVVDLGALATRPVQQLQQLSPGSVDGVVLPQAAVRGASDLVATLEGIGAALRPGGVVVVEMATPEEAWAKNLIHPEVVVVALERSGFVKVQQQSAARAELTVISDGDRASLAKELIRLDRMLCTSPSRALVAHRSEEAE